MLEGEAKREYKLLNSFSKLDWPVSGYCAIRCRFLNERENPTSTLDVVAGFDRRNVQLLVFARDCFIVHCSHMQATEKLEKDGTLKITMKGC